MAQEQVPAQFKGSEIERVLEDGTVQKFDGNKYKIVPRKKVSKKEEKKPKSIVKIIRTTRKVVRVKPTPNNNVSLYTGYGPSGLKREGNKVRTTNDVLFGIGYDRRLTHTTTLRLIGVFNGTGMVGIGFGF